MLRRAAQGKGATDATGSWSGRAALVARRTPSVPLQRRTSIRQFDREPPPDRGPRVNEQIRISPVRLIGVDGEQLGVVPTAQALEKARAANLDLVEVAAHERPPVCRILDYGKMRFENSQKGNKPARSVSRS